MTTLAEQAGWPSFALSGSRSEAYRQAARAVDQLDLERSGVRFLCGDAINFVNVIGYHRLDERDTVSIAIAQRYASASEETRRLVDRLLSQDADDQAWTDQLGPAYRQSDVALLLGKSKQAVSADAGLLKLEMRNGAIGYPAFQFDGSHQQAGAREVVTVLSPVVATSWTIASWLTSSHAELDGIRPIDALRAGRVDEVVTLAHRAARDLAA